MLDINLIRNQFQSPNMLKNQPNLESCESFVKICNNIALKPIEFINLSKNITSDAWKKRFLDLISLEALQEVADCFNEYASIATNTFPNNISSCVLEYSYNSSPRWVTWRISQALLHALFITFQRTPFVELLIELIDTTIGRKLFLTDPTPSRTFSDELPDTVVIATTGSDLDAIIEAIMSQVFTKTPQRYFTVSSILVQDCLHDEFNQKLVAKCEQAVKYRKFGLADEDALKQILKQTAALGAKTKSFHDDKIRGVIVYDVKPMSWSKDLPILSSISFRTTAEALKLIDNLNHFCVASVWGSDSILDFAKKLKCTTVWINSFGRTHPSVTLCPGRNCRYVSARESSVFEEYDELKVGKGAPKNIIRELMLLSEMEPYIKILQKWLNIDNIAVSTHLNITTKVLDPIGLVMIPWSKHGKDLAVHLMIAALATGNHVRFCVDDDERAEMEEFVKPVLSVIPDGVLELGKLGELYGMHPYGSTVDRKTGWRRNLVINSESPDTQDLLWQMINWQYLWLE